MPSITDTYTINDFDREIHACQNCGQWKKNNDYTTSCAPQEVRKHKKIVMLKKREQIVIDRMNARKAKFDEAQAKDEYALYQLQNQRRNAR